MIYSKLFIVGSFPNKKIYGGIYQSCKLILNSSQFSKFELVQFDSSQISNPPPPFFIRFIFAGIRLFRFIFKLVTHRPKATLIFCSDGASALEKGVMIGLSKIVSTNTFIFPRAGNLIRQTSNNKTFRKIIKHLFNKADIFLAQGENWKIFAHENLEIPLSKIKLIHNWTATKEFLDIGSKKNYSSTKITTRFLFVGWLEKEKGIFEILNSIQELNASNLSFSFTFVGNGKAMKKAKGFVAKNQLNEKVVFKGWEENKRLGKYYKNADIFILPSWAEGMPNALIEALSCGLASIVSNVGLIPNYLKNNHNAILINPKSTQELTAAMEKLILDKSLKIKLAKNGYITAKKYFSSKKGLKSLSELIKNEIKNE